MLPPKPENTAFGIRADGKVMEIGFPNAFDAECSARGLYKRGFGQVEIIDLATQRVITIVSKPAPPRGSRHRGRRIWKSRRETSSTP
jgi:hypothetical protein